MELDCVSASVKYTLFFFNLLGAICGILLIVFGSIVTTHEVELKGIPPVDTAAAITTIIAIVLGCIVFIVALMGCYGAIKENNCMTMTYGYVLLVMLICQIVFVVFVCIKQDQFMTAMGKIVDTAWDERDTKIAPMDPIQIEFKCCGKNHPADWIKRGTIPKSCCGSTVSSCDSTNAYQTGCHEAFVEFWRTNITLVKFIGLGIALLEFVGVVFACFLSNCISNSTMREGYEQL